MKKATQEQTAGLLMAEYSIVRGRINSDIDEINKTEIFYLSITAAIYYFAFQLKLSDIFFIRALFLLPVCFSIYSLLRYEAHRRIIQTAEGFLKDWVEPYFLEYGEDPSGYASYYDNKSPKWLKPVRYVFHFTLISATLGFSIWTFCYPDYVVSIVGGVKP